MVPALVGTDNIQYTKYSQQIAKAIKMDALFLIQGCFKFCFYAYKNTPISEKNKLHVNEA